MKMNRLLYYILFLGVGCQASKDISSSSKPVQQVDQVKALEYYIDGVQKESEGYFYDAIQLYKQSLQMDSTTTRAATVYFKISKNYQQLKRSALALQSALKSFQLDSLTVEYEAQVAEMYFENRLFRDAVKQYEKLVDKYPEKNEFLFRLALMYQLNQNLKKALDTFELYITRFGEDPNIRMNQLMIYDVLGERQKIVSILSEMVSDEPDNDQLRFMLSKEYRDQKKYDSAAVILQPILDLNPHNLETLLLLSEIFFLAKDDNKMTTYMSRIVENEDIETDQILAIGQKYIQAGEKDSIQLQFAISLFDVIEKKRPDDWRPKWFMGIYDLSKNNFSSAADRFEIVVTSNPDLVQGWQNLTIAYLQGSQWTEGANASERGVTIHPMDFQLNYFKGFSEFQLKNDSIALHYLNRSVEINPYATEPLIILASVHDRMKNYMQSFSTFEKILAIDPDNDLVLNNYAYLLSERDMELEKAERMSKKSLSKDSTNAAYLDTYGWIMFKLKNYERAEEYILKAIETGEASPVVIEHLGDIYHAMGKNIDALKWWKESLEKKPSNEELRRKIENIQ